MKIKAIKTRKVTPKTINIRQLLDESIVTLSEKTIVVVTSKIISICEGSVIPILEINKEKLVIDESNLYLPTSVSKYGFNFTITNNTLIPMAGIDESNGNGYFILWPKDAQKTANEIRSYLIRKHKLTNLGVVITDSTCQPLKQGTVGIALSHSGFLAVRNYVGVPDLFKRPFKVTQANIAGGIAAAAVLVMGEGTEQTPICTVSNLSSIEFQNRNPTKKELDQLLIPLKEDLFAPFLANVKWKKGRREKYK